MRYVLGIDAGGTKSVGLLADETGQVVAEARGGGANLQTHGELEVEKVFDDLLPLLRTVQPEKLAATLNALASTLDGRGTRLGQNLVLVDQYFTKLNPHLPALQADISGLADLAST